MSEYPKINRFNLVGPETESVLGSPIASATTIAPDHGIHHVTGVAAIQNITVPWEGFSGTIRLVADGTWSLLNTGNINSAVTAAAGNIIQLTYDPTNAKWYPVLLSASGGGITSILPFVADNTGAGNGVLTGRKTMSGTATASNFFTVTGTLPTVLTAQTIGAWFNFITAGSSARDNSGLFVSYGAGYTGANGTHAISIFHTVAGTGVDPIAGTANEGFRADMQGVTAGWNIGGTAKVLGSSVTNIGWLGWTNASSTGFNAGIVGMGANSGAGLKIGGYFVLESTSNPPAPNLSAALLANNGAIAAPIAVFQDAGTAVVTIPDGGGINYDRTITAGGTTGNQTINKAAGTVNFGVGASTLTVTNSLVNTSSIIFCVVRTNDATAILKNVVPGSGSFVITLNAAATAETSVGFLVTN